MATEIARERQAMERTSFCAQGSVPLAQEGIALCEGRFLVALKMANDDESMARMMREQLKWTLRRANLAIRTRTLCFCEKSG